MSRYGMPIHKFIHKYERPPEAPIVYRPHSDLQYPPTPRTGHYEVYAQEFNQDHHLQLFLGLVF